MLHQAGRERRKGALLGNGHLVQALTDNLQLVDQLAQVALRGDEVGGLARRRGLAAFEESLESLADDLADRLIMVVGILLEALFELVVDRDGEAGHRGSFENNPKGPF